MTFSTRCMTDADWHSGKVKFFVRSEFRYPNKMGYEFILWLDKVRGIAGRKTDVTSDYRTPAHNAEVHGAQDSAHEDEPCDAVDLKAIILPDDPNGNLWRFVIVQTAMQLGCTRIGVYKNGSVHLDMTEHCRPAPRLWIQVDNPA
jgi:uncharacterized protein YcbK (DUF882 family)